MTMFPVHQFGLYPSQRNEMQSVPHHYSSFEAIPPQMRADPDRLYYQSWPCSSNHVYACPGQFHGCCEHNNYPGCYGLRSPYTQPPHPYYHGYYPVPQGAYPIHYMPLPPHHKAERPPFEYDKDMGRCYHCWGCPNNSCNKKGGNNVKIEEEGSHLEKKVDESPVPFNFRNYPDPYVWYLPSNIQTNVGKRSNDPQYEKQDESCHNARPNYPYPILWFPPHQAMNKEKQGDDSSNTMTTSPFPLLWFPPNHISNKEDIMPNEPQDEKQEGCSNGSKIRGISKPSEQQRDFVLKPSKRMSQQQADDEPGFPCPIFWIPYKTDQEEGKDHKGTSADQGCAQTVPSHLEISPVMVPAPERKDNSEIGDEVGRKGPKDTLRTNSLKTIPVKQAETNEREKKQDKHKSAEMPLSSSEAQMPSEDSGKRKCPSPTKSSKLPPVCLRVDPLPRKKNANGSSRSPSPPGDKGKPKAVSGENVNPATLLNAKETPQPGRPSRDVMPVKDKDHQKSKTKILQVSEGTGSQEGRSEPSSGSPEGVLASRSDYKPSDTTDVPSIADLECKNVTEASRDGAAEDKSMHFSSQNDENKEKSIEEDKAANVAKEPNRNNLSEAEAARLIQSAYRGYEVRRWEPLKKLKQVRELRKKVAELKSSIQAFESSPDTQGVDKWRTITGETIMNLLLKLDTIQGLHPSIRDVRKSVAKELVGLQEKVDYLTQKKAETIAQKISTVFVGENIENKDDVCIKKGQEEEKEKHANSIDPGYESHQEVACQAESNPGVHVVTSSGNLDTPEIVKDDNENPQLSITEASSETELQKNDSRSDAFTNSQSPDMPMMVTDEQENTLKPTSKGSYAETELEKRMAFPQVGEKAINPALGGMCSSLQSEVSGLRELEELPKEEFSEDICMPNNLEQNNPGEDRASEDEPREDRAPEGEVLNELPTGVFDENTDIWDNYLLKDNQGANEVSAERYLESEELAKLPRGVLEDDWSESNMHLHIEVEEEKDKRRDAATVEVNAEVADGRVPNMNQVEPTQGTVASEANENLECAQNDKNVGLLMMVDQGSEDVVQASGEEASLKSRVVHKHKPEVIHDKEQTGLNTDASNDRSEESGYFASADETPAVTTTTESKEVTETCEEKVTEPSFLERESVNASGGENRPIDCKKSSNKDASEECDVPMQLDKSCDLEHKQKQGHDNFVLQESGGATGALEVDLLNHIESIPLKGQQTEKDGLLPSSPSASYASAESGAFFQGDRKLIEENMRLREMMQKLIETGQEQLTVISNLSSRVKDLEKRISKKKKLKMRQNGTLSSSFLKQSNALKKEKPVGLAM